MCFAKCHVLHNVITNVHDLPAMRKAYKAKRFRPSGRQVALQGKTNIHRMRRYHHDRKKLNYQMKGSSEDLQRICETLLVLSRACHTHSTRSQSDVVPLLHIHYAISVFVEFLIITIVYCIGLFAGPYIFTISPLYSQITQGRAELLGGAISAAIRWET